MFCVGVSCQLSDAVGIVTPIAAPQPPAECCLEHALQSPGAWQSHPGASHRELFSRAPGCSLGRARHCHRQINAPSPNLVISCNNLYAHHLYVHLSACSHCGLVYACSKAEQKAADKHACPQADTQPELTLHHLCVAWMTTGKPLHCHASGKVGKQKRILAQNQTYKDRHACTGQQ